MDLATNLLTAAWQASALRQNTLASDIANIDTPGFQFKDVSFTSALRNALANGANPTAIKPKVVSATGIYANDGNGVDPDKVMALLAENQVRYDVLAHEIQMRVAQYKTAITGVSS